MPARRRPAGPGSRDLEAAATRASALTVASREVSDGFGAVVGAVEELRSSIGEISASTSRASTVAADAVEHAREVTGRVAELQQTSQQIGEIVGAISSITEQSRMLALNATIEAARAGEAGRGFAVVAHEVKELAGKTAQAAERIARQIASVQAQTAAAADGVARITGTIGVIHEAQGAIAAAVEQQSAAAGQIVSSVEVACAGSDRIAGAVAELAEEQRLSFVAAALATAGDLLHERGVTTEEPGVRWTAVSQAGGARREAVLPRLLVGGTWTGQNDDPRVPSVFVDEVHGRVGGTVTLFQRLGPEGDMLRVATDVLTAAGRRNIGTYIPAVAPDGSRSPVLAEVLAGRTYTGDAVVAGRPFTTGYEPVRGASGEVIGMLYVGLPKTG